jgi:formate dehydrogenase major subunit
LRLKQLYQQQGGAFPDPVTKLSWDQDPHAIAKEINGYFLEDTQFGKILYRKGTLVPSFAYLQDDGSTSSGNWLYCNSYTDKGNMMARRSTKDPSGIGLYPGWAWAWPVNRRILYNRASVDQHGKPWDPRRPVIRFNGSGWVGDVPDGGWPPLIGPDGTPNRDAKNAFIMKPAGVAHIFGPGRIDGPFPEHYEPLECPIEKNPLSDSHRINPTARLFSEGPDCSSFDVFCSCDRRYPYVATTFRVSEHWQTGVMTRHQGWQMEMMPQVFVEISRELAAQKGIKNGERVKVSSRRGQLWAIAVVTGRLKPFRIMGSTVHQVALPWCFGWRYPEDGSGGESANLLTTTIGDANTMIPETKAFQVNVAKIPGGRS